MSGGSCTVSASCSCRTSSTTTASISRSTNVAAKEPCTKDRVTDGGPRLHPDHLRRRLRFRCRTGVVGGPPRPRPRRTGSGRGEAVDLSPREVETAPPRRTRSTRWPAIIVLVLVFLAGGIVLTRFLTSSIDYYCNVDEVGSKSGCEAGRRLRVQGTVEEGSVHQDGDVTSFVIAFNDVEML